MRSRTLGLYAAVIVLPSLLALYACGSNGGNGNGSSGGGGDDGGSGSGSGADGNLFGGDGAGGSSGASSSGGPPPFADAGFTAPDCPGCTFPGKGAPQCAGAPPITIYYPNDGVLVPPNMNVISVHWTPFGTAFKEFEVDFENSITDMRVVTKCATQTMDTEQPSQASGGCELQLDPNMWQFVANQNRGGDPVTITVRGTTDGTCASSSQTSVHLSFAQDDVLGAIYYWKSTVSANGVGGDIWVKSFGDSKPEQNVTSGLGATCYGCHSLSRDGVRMSVYSDDNDSDDEYSDVSGTLIDMTNYTPLNGGPPTPGFSTFFPDHTKFISTDGDGTITPANMFSVVDGTNGNQIGTVNGVGAPGSRPTMPDWSPDGKNVAFVLPQTVATWTNSHGATQVDDDHVFGGSLFLLPYLGNNQFGTPTTLLASAGENNYYPGYSPDGQLIAFDRVPLDGTVGGLTGCVSATPSWTRACPNDSFSNPNARVMIMAAHSGATVVDVEALNGSPAASPVPASNSWPKWSPFLQNYKGDKLLWVAFSSLRDYGLRVRNHQPGEVPCYAGDSYEDASQGHHDPFPSNCEQPQLWMAAIDVTKATAGGGDPSRVAFWLPFQDITTHNHTPQWTQSAGSNPPPDGGTSSSSGGDSGSGSCIPQGGNCLQNPSACCSGTSCQANGTCVQIIQ
jgi:hypothetical protein